MSRTITRRMVALREALLSGDAAQALVRVQELSTALQRARIGDDARPQLDTALAELRQLAEASLDGARGAADEVRAIVRAARLLSTYDSHGRRMVAPVAALAARRF